MLVLTVPLASGRTSIHQDWYGLLRCYWGIVAEGKSGRTGSHCSPPWDCCSPGDCRGQNWVTLVSTLSGFRDLVSGLQATGCQECRSKSEKLQCNWWQFVPYFLCNWNNVIKCLLAGKRRDCWDCDQVPVRTEKILLLQNLVCICVTVTTWCKYY